jgi:hypothetical protein
VAVFEEISHFVKNNKFDAPADKTESNLKELYKTDEALKKIQEWLAPKLNEEGTEMEPQTHNHVANVNHMSGMLQWGGTSFGQETCFLLQKSLISFQEKMKGQGIEITNLRLCAKILGSSKD